MSLTKYIVPIVMIAAGVMTGGLSTLASGAMIAGGTLSAVGTATNNKDLMTAGSVIGLAGGIGAAFGVGTANIAQAEGLNALQGVSNTSVAGLSNIAGSEAGITQAASNLAGVGGEAGTALTGTAAQMAANTKSIEMLGKYNLISGLIGGVGQGLASDQASKIAAETQQKQMDIEKDRMNRANSAAGNAMVAPVQLLPNGGTGLLASAPVAVPNIPHAL